MIGNSSCSSISVPIKNVASFCLTTEKPIARKTVSISLKFTKRSLVTPQSRFVEAQQIAVDFPPLLYILQCT